MEFDAQLILAAFASIGITFRGSIADNCKRFKLVGPAYESMPKEQGGHFLIESARHLAGPLRALLDPNVRIVIVIGATQVMKSILGDIWVPFIMEHFPRNMLVLFEDDPKAKLFCDVRLMLPIRQHPVLCEQIGEVDRHDATKTKIKLPTMDLQVCGLNDGNVSSLSWPYIWLSEGWQSKKRGLIKKAIKRADRFPLDCKILIESQAGEEGEDLHEEAKDAHQVPLSWACPKCHGRQCWDFTRLRPDDFCGIGETPPKPGTYSGMKFDAGEDISERARSARWECYHCGYEIRDTQDNRLAIAETYEQDYQITSSSGLKFSSKIVCFILPKESAWNNSFENSTLAFLKAKAAQQSGNLVPIADWYMSERAIFWNPKLVQNQVSIITETADPSLMEPDEAVRVLSVDCQQGDIQFKTGKFWCVARSIDKNGKVLKQLARCYAESWKEWIDLQKRLKIPNDNVAIDGGNYLDEILDAAAANWEIVDRFNPNTKKAYKGRSVWRILVGNGTLSSFPQDDKTKRSFSKPSVHPRVISIDGKPCTIAIPVYHWSNLSVKDHLHRLLSGGEGLPKFIALSRDQLPANVQAKEVGQLTYSQQMQAEYRTTVKGKNKWVESNPNVHYRDCECQILVMFDMAGKLGLPPAPDADGQAV